MDLDTPIPAPVFANKSLKLSYTRFVTFIIIGAAFALFLVSHGPSRQPDPTPLSKPVNLECARLFAPLAALPDSKAEILYSLATSSTSKAIKIAGSCQQRFTSRRREHLGTARTVQFS